MLGLFRSRPNIMALGSRISKIKTTGSEPQTIRLQRVKIRRRWFKPWHFIGGAMAYYVAYNVYTHLVSGHIGKLLEKQIASMSPQERKQLKKDMEEDDSDPFTIPLPLTTKLVQPSPYKGTDPEWQMFIKVAKDKDLMENIKKSLADMARTTLENHPQIKQRFGRNMTVRRHWLELHFPYRPPPTFERQVIEFGDDGIVLATEPVDSNVALKIKNVLWPTALTLSTWAFTTELFKQNLQATARYFGYETQSRDPSADMQATLDKIRRQLAKGQPKAPDAKEQSPLASPKTQSVDGSETASSTTMSPSSTAGSSPPTATTSPDPSGPGPKAGADPDKKASAKDFYGIRQMSDHTSGPWQTFKRKFGQTWKPAGNLPPRGSIGVSGLVEVACPTATMTVEIWAFWDPQAKKFDPKTIQMRLKPIRMKHQAPLR
ncbi:hypothetical protein PG997_011938 [Apiospora hydei]|uniref:Uncharacterized protein n=1 Tax=Apiospora hydei TaxID=1337664 RepID=A0ABR1V1W2_9PEZI